MTTSTHISPEGLMPILSGPATPLLLDVRTPAEFETSHIPGSINVPLGLVENHAEDLSASLEGNIVIICRSGARAQRAQQYLEAVGVNNLQVLDGGIEGWKKDTRRPLKSGATRWDLERQVRLVAGGLVGLSILASTKVPVAKWVAGGVGAGLTYAAVSNTCMMGNALMKLPYNQGQEVSLKEAQRMLKKADK